MDPIFEHKHRVGNFHDTVDYRVSGLERAFPLVDRYREALLVGKTIALKIIIVLHTQVNGTSLEQNVGCRLVFHIIWNKQNILHKCARGVQRTERRIPRKRKYHQFIHKS